VRDHVYGVLRAAGIAQGQIVRVERIVSTLAIGFAAGEVAGRFPGGRAARGGGVPARAILIRAGIAPFRDPRVDLSAGSPRPRRRRAVRSPRRV
jgi:hypothetical protein